MTELYTVPNSKHFADNKINVTSNLKFVFNRKENNLEKGENAGNGHFLLFPRCLSKPSCFKELYCKGLSININAKRIGVKILSFSMELNLYQYKT